MLVWSSLRTAPQNMINTPAMVRINSGRMRMYSTPEGIMLSSIGDLRVRLHLLQNSRVLRADRWHESLRVDSHPEHEEQQRKSGSPFPGTQVRHVMQDA